MISALADICGCECEMHVVQDLLASCNVNGASPTPPADVSRTGKQDETKAGTPFSAWLSQMQADGSEARYSPQPNAARPAQPAVGRESTQEGSAISSSPAIASPWQPTMPAFSKPESAGGDMASPNEQDSAQNGAALAEAAGIGSNRIAARNAELRQIALQNGTASDALKADERGAYPSAYTR